MRLVSVIVPVYNGEKYLRRCIDSILAQKYKNFELILVDDGSTDDSYDICKNYEANDQSIKLFHQNNSGQSAARNFGLEKSKGYYIVFVDCDDWVENNLISDFVESAERYNADIVQGGVEKNWDSHSEIYRMVESAKVFNKHDAMKDICDYINDRDHSTLMNGVWCKLYKKAFFSNCHFTPNRIWEDTQIQGRLIDQANMIVAIPGIHYHYYQGRNDNISNIHSKKSLVDSWLSHKERFDDFSSTPCYADLYQDFVLCCFDSIIKVWTQFYCSTGDAIDYKVQLNDMYHFLKCHSQIIETYTGGKRNTLDIAAVLPPPFSIRVVYLLRLLKGKT